MLALQHSHLRNMPCHDLPRVKKFELFYDATNNSWMVGCETRENSLGELSEFNDPSRSLYSNSCHTRKINAKGKQL